MAEQLRLISYFPGLSNIHLAKDVGKIPYVMERDFNYQSLLVHRDSQSFSFHNSETPKLTLKTLPKSSLSSLLPLIRHISINPFDGDNNLLRTFIDAIRLFYGQDDIDVLFLVGLSARNILVAAVYRLLGGDGFVFIKVDWNNQFVDQYSPPKSSVRRVSKEVFRTADPDVIAPETEYVTSFLRNKHWLISKHANRIEKLPTCVDVTHLSDWDVSYDQKEHVVLHVGRMGSESKASHVVLDGFVQVAPHFPDWTLVLIGSMTDKFAQRYKKTLEKYPEIEDQIEYLGFVSDRERLYQEYQRANIFAFPSRYEGFSIALLEAGYFGCVPLVTDIPPFRDFTDDGRLGYMFPVDDIPSFIDCLSNAISDGETPRNHSRRIHERVVKFYNWNSYCARMDELVRQTHES